MPSPEDPRAVVRQAYERLGDADKDETHDVLAWLDRAVAGLARGSAVLDLGCGDGTPVTGHLVELGFVVTGVDLTPSQIARARRSVPGATFLVGDMVEVNWPDHAFDAVVALYSVLHVPADEQAVLFARIGRWLRPGGRFLLVVGDAAWTGVDDFHGEPMYWGDAGPEAVAGWLADAGLTVTWRHREPEPPGAHIVFLAERRAGAEGPSVGTAGNRR